MISARLAVVKPSSGQQDFHVGRGTFSELRMHFQTRWLNGPLSLLLDPRLRQYGPLLFVLSLGPPNGK